MSKEDRRAAKAQIASENTDSASSEKSESTKKPRYGASIIKGSMSEPDPMPVIREDSSGFPMIDGGDHDPDFPQGYTENNTTVTVSLVDKSQYKDNLSNSLTSSSNPGAVDALQLQSNAAMSMDGLLIPFSASFTSRSSAGINAEYVEADDGAEGRPSIEQNRLPPYEKPSPLIDYWHAGSGLITSATLNPFSLGHHISVLSRGTRPGNIDTRSDGGGEVGEMLGNTPGDPRTASRPIALRGPLVMTGWGYNTENLPVPNMKRDALDRETNPRSENFGMPIKLPKSQQHTNPKINFLSGHMTRVDQWKTGPVDLRWDDARKVWTSPGMNRVYLSKAARCILPTAGPDGKNSWNFGVNNVVGVGRQYRNPCPSDVCKYDTYFPKSQYYPDIEIYDPEDRQWCGKCQVKKTPGPRSYPYLACDSPETACVPFYDAIILRSMGHIVSGRNVKSDCGDKFRKTTASDPYSKRVGNPCHGWGSSYDGIFEYLPDKVEGVGEANEEYSESAYSILYQRIFIENPLSQGLMLGDSFLSYDTGRRITMTYMRSKDGHGCGQGGEAISVTESLPVHVILQAEFVGVEVVTNSSCEQGEWGACTRKVMVQGMTTPKDCGPDDDYPSTSAG